MNFTQAGQQEVNIGKFSLLTILFISSVPSSTTVISAPKLVSNTFWKPIFLADGAIFPPTFFPIGRLNSSPSVAFTAEAAVKIKYFPLFKASFTKATSFLTLIAVVGQTRVHCPQYIHPLAPNVPCFGSTVLLPLSTAFNTDILVSCAHVNAQAVHPIHFSYLFV